jgi:hypothetical protein
MNPAAFRTGMLLFAKLIAALPLASRPRGIPKAAWIRIDPPSASKARVQPMSNAAPAAVVNLPFWPACP